MLFPKFFAVFTAFAVTGASAQKCKCKANPCTTNLVKNGGFDSPLDGSPWIFSNMEVTSYKPRSSPQAALSQIEDSAQRNAIVQSVPLVEGESYTLRYYWTIVGGTFAASGGCEISASLDNFHGDDALYLSDTPQGTYSLHEWTFTAPANSKLNLVVFCKRDATLDVNVDDVSIYPASCLNPT
ncbi:unnamed protein product [Clonostachys solani]|uniref:Uncharacterized protein n=1 Tax=Clonostachys solani TaxID=160281 RepID=A0A9N9Z032_9HYPO|nr:unnamed protein product [Clonostachys solani]